MTGGLVQHGDTPQWFMMIPTVDPIIVPLPSLGHRQFCVAGLARGHPDSGGAAIMGVPLPHPVLPLLCGHVGRRRAHRTMTLGSVCCLCIASRCGCRPASGMSTPSRCGAWCTADVNGVATLVGHNGCAILCVAIAVVGPTLVTPDDREVWEDEGAIRLYLLVYLCRCSGRLL